MTTIDTRISPALHPSNVAQIEGYEDTKAVLGSTETAFSTAYEAVRAVYEARAHADKNPGWTDEQKLLQVDTFAGKHLAKIAQRFDTVRSELDRGINYLEGELSTALTEQAAATFGKEIREHVKGLTTPQRQKFIQDAIDAGDEQVVAGVLGAPAFLSGMDAVMQKTLTRFWNERQQPDKAKRLKVMQAAKAMIERDAGKVFAAMEKAVGGQSDKANKVREAQTAAEKALAFKDA